MSSTAHGTEEHDAFQAQTEAACRKRCCSQIAHYNMQWIKEYKGYKGHVHLIGGFDNIYITLSIPNSVINGRWFPWVEPPSSEAMQMKSKPPQLGHLGQQALPSSEGQRSRWSQCKVHSPRSNNDSLDMSWHVLTVKKSCLKSCLLQYCLLHFAAKTPSIGQQQLSLVWSKLGNSILDVKSHEAQEPNFQQSKIVRHCVCKEIGTRKVLYFFLESAYPAVCSHHRDL